MELNEGQAWAYREDKSNQYSKYLVIDYVNNSHFSCREMDVGNTSYSLHDFDYLLDDSKWELLDTEKICHLLEDHIAVVQMWKENAELCDSAQEAAAKERKMRKQAEQDMQRVLSTNNVLEQSRDLYRSKANDLELDVEELRKNLKELKQELSDALEENKKMREIIDRLNVFYQWENRHKGGVVVYFKDGVPVFIKGTHVIESVGNEIKIADNNGRVFASFSKSDIKGYVERK